MGQETGRSIAFSVRNLSVVPLNQPNGLTVGAPIALDTLQEAQFKLDLTLEDLRGGAYLAPLAADIKEFKGELSAKLVDTPPALVSLLNAGTYTKSTSPGPVLSSDGLQNIQGTSISARITVTTPGTPVTGDYVIVATTTSQYVVYNVATGVASAAFTIPGTDSVSVTGVTLTSTAGTFTVGDAATFTVFNVGNSGSGQTVLESVVGPTTYPVIPPQARIFGTAMRRGVQFKFILYWTELEGIAYPMGQGKFVVPDFKARVLQQPYNAPAPGQLWRFDMVA